MGNRLINTSRETSGFFSIILEKLKVAAVFILNKEGIVLDINSGVTQSYGYEAKDLLGKNFEVLFIEEDRKKGMPQEELHKVLTEGSAMDQNYILHKSGKEIWSHGESVYVGNESSEQYITKVVFDIDIQKRLQIDLQARNEELHKVNKDLDIFVYTASHDLKAPISNIEALVLALFDELSSDSKEKPGIREIMHMIQHSIDKFKTTINDLSAIGKSTEENVEVPDFKEIMEDVKMNLKEDIENFQPVIHEDFSKTSAIRFSKKNLRSIIQNLVSNAIKYHSPKRLPEITISTDVVSKDCILLQVTDNGLGIRHEDKGKIFSMYHRLHDHVEGTGVGMSIVKKIVENNGGTIEIDSEVGVGSTFKVYLKAEEVKN